MDLMKVCKIGTGLVSSAGVLMSSGIRDFLDENAGGQEVIMYNSYLIPKTFASNDLDLIKLVIEDPGVFGICAEDKVSVRIYAKYLASFVLLTERYLKKIKDAGKDYSIIKELCLVGVSGYYDKAVIAQAVINLLTEKGIENASSLVHIS